MSNFLDELERNITLDGARYLEKAGIVKDVIIGFLSNQLKISITEIYNNEVKKAV